MLTYIIEYAIKKECYIQTWTKHSFFANILI